VDSPLKFTEIPSSSLFEGTRWTLRITNTDLLRNPVNPDALSCAFSQP